MNILESNNQLTIEDVIPKNALNNDEAKKELNKIKETEKSVDSEKLIYKTNEYIYGFKNFQTIKTFDRDTHEGKITIEEADEYQKDLLVEIMSFRKKYKTKESIKETRKRNCSKKLYNFWEGREKIIDAF